MLQPLSPVAGINRVLCRLRSRSQRPTDAKPKDYQTKISPSSPRDDNEVIDDKGGRRIIRPEDEQFILKEGHSWRAKGDMLDVIDHLNGNTWHKYANVGRWYSKMKLSWPVDPVDIKKFADGLQKDGLQPQTIGQYLTAIVMVSEAITTRYPVCMILTNKFTKSCAWSGKTPDCYSHMIRNFQRGTNAIQCPAQNFSR